MTDKYALVFILIEPTEFRSNGVLVFALLCFISLNNFVNLTKHELCYPDTWIEFKRDSTYV